MIVCTGHYHFNPKLYSFLYMFELMSLKLKCGFYNYNLPNIWINILLWNVKIYQSIGLLYFSVKLWVFLRFGSYVYHSCYYYSVLRLMMWCICLYSSVYFIMGHNYLFSYVYVCYGETIYLMCLVSIHCLVLLNSYFNYTGAGA